MVGLNAGTIKVVNWVPVSNELPPDPPTPPPAPAFSLTGLSVESIDRAVGGSTSTVIVEDRVYTRSTSAGVYQDKQMNLLYLGELPSAVVWTSTNTSVATVDSDGFVTNLASGTSTIRATVGAAYLQKVIAFTVTASTVSDELTNYSVGSLAKHVSDAVDARLVGKSASTNMRLFTTQTHSTSTYVRNTTAWPADLGSALCSISPWNSTGSNVMAGVAISPLHIIFAAHFQIGTGAIIRFVLADNTVITRTMVSKLTPAAISSYFPDITIGRLDSPLPETVQIAKILPDNWTSYLPSLTGQTTVPALCLDQEEKAIVTDVASLNGMASFTYPNWVNWSKRAEFYENKIGGDSGNPAFIIVNNQLVLLCVWTYGGAGSGTFITPQRNTINTLMSQLGGNYTLTDVDLTPYFDYAAPTLDFNFAGEKTLDSRITFTRASVGTYFDSAGVMQTAAINTPRFTHDPVTLESKGLLVEEARTNLLLRSQEMGDAYWTNTGARLTITADQTTAPDGINSADKVEIAINNALRLARNTNGLVAGTTYTFSFFTKNINCTTVGFLIGDSGENNNVTGNYNFTTGVVSLAANAWNCTSRVVALASGWVRIELTATIPAGLTSLRVSVSPQSTGGGAVGLALYLWGMQLELGSHATSYIPTTTASATRAGDFVSMTGTNFSDWYRADEGTFIADVYPLSITQQAAVVGVHTTSYFQSRLIFKTNSMANGLGDRWVGFSYKTSSRITATGEGSANTRSIVALSYGPNQDTILANGGAAITSSTSSGGQPTPDKAFIGQREGSRYLNSPIARIRYYNRRLPTAQLQEETTL